MKIGGKSTGKVKNYGGLNIKIFSLYERTEQIMDILEYYIPFIQEKKGEVQAIFFTKNVGPLKIFYENFKKKFPNEDSVGYWDGTCQIPSGGLLYQQQFIFATTGVAGEGTNLPKILFVFLLNSVKNPNQIVSRGFRMKETLIPPIIVQVIDNEIQWHINHFKSCEFSII